LLSLLICTLGAENDRPIIGIFTQPSPSVLSRFGNSYIAASYVKFIESAGARVVPIFYKSSQADLKKLFNSINGILFPGGSASLSPDLPFYKAAFFLYQLALDANDKGDFFQLQGHCIGFELLHLMTSRNSSLLGWVDAENISMPLNFVPGFRNSRLFNQAPDDIVNILGSQSVTLNNHMRCVTPGDYNLNPALGQFYSILSTNFDRKNVSFVSTVEGKNYPVYAIQWHAEKPIFEWNPNEAIPHSPDAIRAMQYFASYFVNQARQSMHKFPSQAEEDAAVIYNYHKTYTGKIDPGFEECYMFNE